MATQYANKYDIERRARDGGASGQSGFLDSIKQEVSDHPGRSIAIAAGLSFLIGALYYTTRRVEPMGTIDDLKSRLSNADFSSWIPRSFR